MTNSAAPSLPWPELLADLRAFVGRRVADPHDAEDLVQDTLAKLAAQLRQGPPPGPVHAWLLRVARNAVVDHWRRREPGREPAEDLPAAEPGPVDGAACKPLLQSFRSFVHALPPEQRDAVLRTEYEGLSQAALARELGVPLSTVKARVQRGRKRLAKALHDCCTFEFDRRGRVLDWQRRPGGDCENC